MTWVLLRLMACRFRRPLRSFKAASETFVRLRSSHSKAGNCVKSAMPASVTRVLETSSHVRPVRRFKSFRPRFVSRVMPSSSDWRLRMSLRTPGVLSVTRVLRRLRVWRAGKTFSSHISPSAASVKLRSMRMTGDPGRVVSRVTVPPASRISDKARVSFGLAAAVSVAFSSLAGAAWPYAAAQATRTISHPNPRTMVRSPRSAFLCRPNRTPLVGQPQALGTRRSRLGATTDSGTAEKGCHSERSEESRRRQAKKRDSSSRHCRSSE